MRIMTHMAILCINMLYILDSIFKCFLLFSPPDKLSFYFGKTSTTIQKGLRNSQKAY